jgi:hypothetical protein
MDTPKSAKQRLIEWIEILASFSTVLGLIGLYFVYRQLVANEEQMKLNTFSQVYSEMVEIDKFFVEHPDARLYIYANLRPADVYPNATPEQAMLATSVEAAAGELMLDFFSHVTLVSPNLGDPAQSWLAYIKDVYKCSPIVRERYQRKLAWYKEEAAAPIIDEAEAELKQGSVLCDAIQPPAQP